MRVTIHTEIDGECVTATGEAWHDVAGVSAIVDGEWPDGVRLQLEFELADEFERQIERIKLERAIAAGGG